MQSDDMSMLRKMKDRIADEATNRLQTMQQLSGQLMSSDKRSLANKPIPTQLLPEPSSSGVGRPSLSPIDRVDGSTAANVVYTQVEELDSDISPQHQLFDEQSIKRLSTIKTSNGNTHDHDKPDHKQQATSTSKGEVVRPTFSETGSTITVINIDELSSDLEDSSAFNEEDSKDDVEIDLLNDKDALAFCDPTGLAGANDTDELTIFKTRYRNVVRFLRILNKNHLHERTNLERQIHDLNSALTTLKSELDEVKRQNQSNHDSLLSNSTSASEVDRTQNVSPQPSSKAASKIKDQERLIAKCKESLKAKNSQLKILRDALANVDKFEESFEQLRTDLKDLKNTHGTWTVSIAESKRVMHQEIENKNAEIDSLKSDIKNLQNQLRENQTRCMNLKSNLQGLESRMVSTSAAHQKERESLIKELNTSKSNAIKQIQNEHKLNIERVKIDLEKSIEALKSEILIKDEQIIKDTKLNQELNDKNLALTDNLESIKRELSKSLASIGELNSRNDSLVIDNSELRDKIGSFKCDKCETLANSERQLNSQLGQLAEKVKALEQANTGLSAKLEDAEKLKAAEIECQNCQDLRERLQTEAERFEQSRFEQATQLDLLQTANADLERALSNLRLECDSAGESLKSLRPEYDELVKKNESLTRILQDNENEMQSQQEQIDRLATYKRELDDLRKENLALTATLEQIKTDVADKNSELKSSRDQVYDLTKKLDKLEVTLIETNKDLDSLRKEKDSIQSTIAREVRAKQDADEQLIVNILAAMKNLETPNTSPGSDKIYESAQLDQQSGETGKPSIKCLPDPVKLASELSSLALDRSTAYLTAVQRLQAVLLDQTMMSEEIGRLKEELTNINRERHVETQQSVEEFEKLKTENQALIHDQKAYDDRIADLEAEVGFLAHQVEQQKNSVTTTCEAFTETEPLDNGSMRDMHSIDRENFHTTATPVSCCESNHTVASSETKDVPDPTEFEYLRNIIFQFMLGKEPLVLGRVIAAILKFDKAQLDQICRSLELDTRSKQ